MIDISEERAEEILLEQTKHLEKIKELEKALNAANDEFKAAHEYAFQKQGVMRVHEINLQQARANMATMAINSLYELLGMDAPLHYTTDKADLIEHTKQ